MNICTLNKIAACGTDRLGANYTITDTLEGAAGVLVRSAAMHDMTFGPDLLPRVADFFEKLLPIYDFFNN